MFADFEQEHPRLKESLLAAMGNIETGRQLDTRYLDLEGSTSESEPEALFPILAES